MSENLKEIIPTFWECERLGDFVITEKGKKPKNISNIFNDTCYLPYVNIKAFEKNIIDEYTDGKGCVLCEEDDFVMVWDGSRSGYVGKSIKGALGSTLVKIKFPGIYIEYAYYFLQSKYLEINTRAKGVGIPHVDPALLWNYHFPIPPLPEQHRIVTKIEELFSSLDKGIESLKTARQQLKVYRQAVLKWAFEGKLTEEWRSQQKNFDSSEILLKQIKSDKELNGKKFKPLTQITNEEMSLLPILPKEWCWVKLGDNAFVTKLAGFEFTKYVKYKDEGDIPVIRAQNVSKSSFIPRNFLYVGREIMEKLPRSRVYGGEVLMVFVGAGLGNVGIVPNNVEYFLGPNVAKIAVEKQFINKYIFYFLSSTVGFGNVTGMTKATAQGSISMANIREVLIPLISIQEQQRIVSEIESRLSVCDKIEESIEYSLNQAEALRQSILKKAFEGKLVPQDPNDEPASVLLERIRAERTTAVTVKTDNAKHKSLTAKKLKVKKEKT